jgi:hypothetical protein
MKQANPPPAPITFACDIMTPPVEPGGMSQITRAGTASPWRRIEDVPPNLREHIGEPPQPNFNVENFRAETRLIQETLEPENETVRAILGNINDEAHARATALAATVIVNESPKGTYD